MLVDSRITVECVVAAFILEKFACLLLELKLKFKQMTELNLKPTPF